MAGQPLRANWKPVAPAVAPAVFSCVLKTVGRTRELPEALPVAWMLQIASSTLPVIRIALLAAKALTAPNRVTPATEAAKDTFANFFILISQVNVESKTVATFIQPPFNPIVSECI
ncbi:hypothetical protein D3C85_1407240 [compost metagenome]